MVQSLNPSAIWTLSTAVLRRPSLMIPDYQVATIADVNWESLRQQQPQLRAAVFDKDNTLTAPYANEIHPTCQKSIKQAMQVFSAGAVAVLSNSAGTVTDDPDGVDATAFEQANVTLLDGKVLPVIRHQDKKPSRKCLEQTMQHFGTETVQEPAQIVMIGDRLWTDVVFGNLYGCTTIYAAQTLHDKTDNWTAKLLRPVEQRTSRFWQRVLRKQPLTLKAESQPKHDE